MALAAPARRHCDSFDIGLEGALAAWFDALPYTVEACPRKRFEHRRPLPRQAAIEMDEIAPDPPGWVTSVRIDIDEPDGSTRWLDAGLPQPNFIIVNPTNGHAQYVYRLGAGAWVDERRPRSVRYLRAIRRAYTIAVDGDLGYSGAMHHSPLSSTYKTTIGPDCTYELGELAMYVDLFRPVFRTRGNATIDADREALGPNCYVFEHCRMAAYRDVPRYRPRNDREGFAGRVHEHALRAAEEYEAAGGRTVRAVHVRSVAKSVVRWCWDVYGRGGENPESARARYELTRDEYLAKVAERRSKALEMRETGMSLSGIAQALNVSRRTVCNYLAAQAQVELVKSPPLSEFARPSVANKVSNPVTAAHVDALSDRGGYAASARSAKYPDSVSQGSDREWLLYVRRRCAENAVLSGNPSCRAP